MSELPVPSLSLPETPRPQTFVCANCHAELSGEYCAACGQRHEPHIHTVAHFAGEAFESISHADSRLWRTLWYLFARPAFLTREFFAGRRVAYLPPFRLYLVLSVIFFLLTGLSSGGADPDDAALVRDPAAAVDQAAKQVAAAGVKLPEEADEEGLHVRIQGLDDFCKPFTDTAQGGANAQARGGIILVDTANIGIVPVKQPAEIFIDYIKGAMAERNEVQVINTSTFEKQMSHRFLLVAAMPARGTRSQTH